MSSVTVPFVQRIVRRLADISHLLSNTKSN